MDSEHMSEASSPADPHTDAPIDLGDPRIVKDPFSAYTILRERGRLVPALMPFQGGEVLAVPHYEDARALMADKRILNDPTPLTKDPSSNTNNIRAKMLESTGLPSEYVPYVVDAMILDLDPPDHTRIRKHVSQTFTVKRVNAMRPRVREITDELLARLPDHAENGVVDLIEHFAYPLPITVICQLVGVPEDQHGVWRELGRDFASLVPEERVRGIIGIVEQTKALVELRRSTPTDDLITALIGAHDDRDSLSDTELVAIVLALVVAGHETTAHLIGNGALALLTHPDQLRLLREDTDLAPRAVHELMRWCGPIQGTRTRYAGEDMEVNGMHLRRGQAILALLGSANHDPSVFPDPGRLDLTREPAGRRETHMGFGHGPHYCLGAALARQEGELAFTRLFDHYPGLALAVPEDEVPRAALPLSLRLEELPVRLG